MERAPAVFPEQAQVGVVIETLRDVIRARQIVYVFCVDAARKFTGVVAFRELLFSDRDATLESVMVHSPFALQCGQPCQTCRHRCEYQAIQPTGAIVYEECFQCMDCVVIYESDALCAPRIAQRHKGRVIPMRAVAGTVAVGSAASSGPGTT